MARLVRSLRRGGRRGPPVCENVKEWAAEAQPDSTPRVLLGPRRFTRALPRTVEPAVLPAYLDRVEASQREKYLVEIRGARLVGDSGIVVLPDGCYASESVYTRAVLERQPEYTGAARRKRVVAKAGDHVSLLTIWARSGIYYHWMHDTLTRLHGVLEWLPPGTRFVVPANLKPYQAETLGLLGIDASRLVPFTGDEVWELERLHFTPPTSNSGNHRREVDEWLRDAMVAAYGIEPVADRRRIYVSRRDVQTRRVVNEDGVEEVLRRYRFETVLPETLSLRGQIELFTAAEAVVSTHGSAFTNAIFSPPGLVLVDMVPPVMTSNAYVFWALCEELGHEYWYFLAESADAGGRQPDTVVPLDKLEATLERTGLSRSRP